MKNRRVKRKKWKLNFGNFKAIPVRLDNGKRLKNVN
jgi:hypothetical protein